MGKLPRNTDGSPKGLQRLQLGVRWSTQDTPTLTREELETAARCANVVQRIEWLEFDMLPTGRYHPRMLVQLGEAWGIRPASAAEHVAEAWRRIATGHAPERAEEIRARLLARIDRIGEESLNRTKQVVTMSGEVVDVRDPDCRTALQAVVEFATLTNVREQRWRHQVDLTKMDESEILEQLKAQGYSVERRQPVLLTDGEEVEKKE